MTMGELVSIVMPVYNVEPFIGEALDSVCKQSHQNLEIIIVDDHCTDATMDIVYAKRDPRVVILHNESNVGLAVGLNRGFSIAKGDYVARMDADDICHPERVARQVTFMAERPHVQILGTAMQYFGASRYLNTFPADHESCKALLLFNVCVGHPTVMLRREVVSYAHYDPALLQYSEDYDLWCRLIFGFRFANLEEPLLAYRTYPVEFKFDAESRRMQNAQTVRSSYVRRLWPSVSDDDLATHDFFSSMKPANSRNDLEQIDLWLHKILDLNIASPAIDEMALSQVIAGRFFEYCYAMNHLGWKAMRYYNKSRWASLRAISGKHSIKFAAKVVANKIK